MPAWSKKKKGIFWSFRPGPARIKEFSDHAGPIQQEEWNFLAVPAWSIARLQEFSVTANGLLCVQVSQTIDLFLNFIFGCRNRYHILLKSNCPKNNPNLYRKTEPINKDGAENRICLVLWCHISEATFW